jgi:hypothetical protein
MYLNDAPPPRSVILKAAWFSLRLKDLLFGPFAGAIQRVGLGRFLTVLQEFKCE